MTNEKDTGAEVEVRIYSIATSLTESIIFLDETEGTRILPIWIGPMEAQAIAIRLSGYPSPRPMTHDLIFSVIKTLGLTLRKVTITDIVENTYYSQLHLCEPGGANLRLVDSRPSDAVALAVRLPDLNKRESIQQNPGAQQAHYRGRGSEVQARPEEP